MHFTKLRLHGFKSFVEPAELLIEPGLTGIVGPNGCGKSNLVEALQWVMGEGSARRLRGGEMDDVIFGGTTSRPARNIATVSLSLDNSDRTASGDLAGFDDIEIDRRIDRGKGSAYRVNGREFRARDVQILFADAASGAQSASLIGQGRIGWLINAKPTERRGLLEEAAGIGGLHARRRDAETRLTAAETNLARLQDIQTNLSTQIERLKKQAKQAERYRSLSDQIRIAEALMLYRQWLDQDARVKDAAARLLATEARVAETAAHADSAEATRLAAQEALPALRSAVTEAIYQVERRGGALLALEAEQKLVAEAIATHRRNLAQLEQDARRERSLAADAAAARVRLDAERAALIAEQATEQDDTASATERLAAAHAAVEQAETALSEATARVATIEAARQAATRRIAAIEERRRRVQRQVSEAEARTRELDLLAVSQARLDAADAAVRDAESAVVSARAEIEEAELQLRSTEQQRHTTRQTLATADHAQVKIRAEIDALRSLVRSGQPGKYGAALDQVSVTSGLETALGAALGDDLFAALDSAAPIHWADLPPETESIDPLPDGADCLAASVEAPERLARRLNRIGVVADAASGHLGQAQLKPGQMLVARDGAAWRWDGLVVAAGAPTAAAIRLAQRNRLRDLEQQRAQIEADLAAATAQHQQAEAAFEAARQRERSARAGQLQASQRQVQVRQEQITLNQQHGQALERRKAALDLHERLTQEFAEISGQAADAEREFAALPDAETGRQQIATLRTEMSRLRETETLHQRELDRLVRDSAARARRLAAISAETESWREREQGAALHAAALAERQRVLAAEAASLDERPAALERDRAEQIAAIAVARAQAEAQNGRLGEAERVLGEAERVLGEAKRAHGEAREQRVRAEASHEQSLEARQAASRRAVENFDCPAEHLPRVADIPATPSTEPGTALEARFERLRREREAIGPVNLMAETEMAQLSAELTTIRTESDDLIAAIARLRQGISQLNREGRERLTRAFAAVNTHFQSLFVRLFGGGRAYLELIDSESDPLSAGLEIMASPPGKKLQALSLLSGGERALTALALIFAVFLTNPAPVCVLDEVDAPLDDANVERFCALVREIAERTGTRFLIITHHRVSMARMDRLYGVTMIERGISQLVSVELQTAEQLRQTA